MAQPMHCDGCPDEMATVIVNIIDTGDVQAFGPQCYADFSYAYLNSVRPEVLAPAKPKRTTKTRGTPARALADDSQGNQETAPANVQ